jgi:hypothetical protein
MQTTPIAIVGVHLAKRGLGGCDLKRITRQKGKLKDLGQTLSTEYGLALETEASSTGREPCVLAKFEDGTTSMHVTWQRLMARSKNSKKPFEASCFCSSSTNREFLCDLSEKMFTTFSQSL